MKGYPKNIKISNYHNGGARYFHYTGSADQQHTEEEVQRGGTQRRDCHGQQGTRRGQYQEGLTAAQRQTATYRRDYSCWYGRIQVTLSDIQENEEEEAPLKSVFMLCVLPLADQAENLQNFTSFCRTVIKVQEISGKAQLKAWKMKKPTPYLVSIIPRGNFGETAGFLQSELLAPAARSAAQFLEQERKELEEVSRSNIEHF